MKKLNIGLYLAACSLILLSGCASYQSSPLHRLNAVPVKTPAKKGQVLFAHRVYTKADCEKYLGRDIIKAGYQPVQLTIVNETDHVLNFSLENVSMPCVSPEEFKEKLYTDTTGRAVGYGVGALFLWPLLIPAIVDPLKSSEANKQLDIDYNIKSSDNQTICPDGTLNGIIFTPLCDFQKHFTVTLLDAKTSEKFVLKASGENEA